MIDYRRAGKLPVKPHTAFRDEASALYHEHCFTRGGFDGPFSILYHRHPPQDHGDGSPHEALWPERREADEAAHDGLRRRHLRSQQLAVGGSATTGRTPLLFNADITVSRDGMSVPATSIMGLMMLGAAIGTSISVEARGPEAEEAISALAQLVASKFDEE